MKKIRKCELIWLTGCLLLLAFSGYSQIDRGSMLTPTPLGTPTKAGTGFNSTSSSLLKDDNSTLSSDKFQSYSRENEPKKMMGDDGFHKDKHTFTPNYLKNKEKEENSEGVTDQYFGDFSNNGGYVQLVYRDFGSVDGDLIRIYLDDDIIRGNVYLTGDYTGLIIDLIQGSNKIVIEALNQGTSGPNTAQFQVFDDTGKLITSNQWNLLAGGKATMIIVKE